jgi:transcriptional regulator with XRE-family HTH domain
VQHFRKMVKGWSQEQLAAECERVRDTQILADPLSCSRGSVQRMEKGERVFPSTVRCAAIALGVPYTRLLKSSLSAANTWAHNIDAGPNPELDYRSIRVEAALRVIEPAKHYVLLRHQEVVALRDNFDKMRIGFGPRRGTAMSAKLVEPLDHTLREISNVAPDVDRRAFELQFNKPLNMGDRISFTLEIESKAVDAPLPSEHVFFLVAQAEELTLRLGFTAIPPGGVIYRMHGCDGRLIEENPVAIDLISYEARQRIADPIVGHHYSLNWL